MLVYPTVMHIGQKVHWSVESTLTMRPVMVGNLNAGVGSDPPFASWPWTWGVERSWRPSDNRFVLTVTAPLPFRALKNKQNNTLRWKKRHSIAWRISLGSFCIAVRRGEVISRIFYYIEVIPGNFLCIVISHALHIYSSYCCEETWRSMELGCMLG